MREVTAVECAGAFPSPSVLKKGLRTSWLKNGSLNPARAGATEFYGQLGRRDFLEAPSFPFELYSKLLEGGYIGNYIGFLR